MAGNCSRRYERMAWQRGFRRVAGTDEVGRGALFGPVVAAAVILDPKRRIPGLDDSKRVPPRRRLELAEKIRARALACAVAYVNPERIDAWNIYQASRQAMVAALGQLYPVPDFVLSDALPLQLGDLPCLTLIHGDARSVSIAAASILAKVERDALMAELDQLFPDYGLARHKGYATREHLEKLRQHGPTPLHRRSFAPVRACSDWVYAAEQEPLPF
ncbi:MAG: ribonuclease HII [Acidobacteria bacterium]|nr:ribonuclease HII [Acidobacteriota bacterium]